MHKTVLDQVQVILWFKTKAADQVSDQTSHLTGKCRLDWFIDMECCPFIVWCSCCTLVINYTATLLATTSSHLHITHLFTWL